MVGVSPSGSVAVAEHVSRSLVLMLLLGLMLWVVNTGFEFRIETVVLSSAVPPSASTTVALHSTVSEGDVSLLFSVIVEPVPKAVLVVVFVQT